MTGVFKIFSEAEENFFFWKIRIKFGDVNVPGEHFVKKGLNGYPEAREGKNFEDGLENLRAKKPFAPRPT